MKKKIEQPDLAAEVKKLRKNIEAISAGQLRTEYMLLERVATKKDVGRLANAILKNDQGIQDLRENMATKMDIQHEERLTALKSSR